jgi:hypothetical protein
MTTATLARPWYATNARNLLETRQRNLKPVEPVLVSLVGGDFTDIAATALYVRQDMPTDRMDWRMLVDLDVWLWAGPDAPMEWIADTAWHIAHARPRELLIRFETAAAIHDINLGSGTHRPSFAGLPPEHRFWWLPINLGGTSIGYRVLKALKAKHPPEALL